MNKLVGGKDAGLAAANDRNIITGVHQFDSILQYSFGGALEFKLKGTPEFVWTVTKRKFTSAAEYLEGMLDMMDIMEDALET